jgi:hypothetical protein
VGATARRVRNRLVASVSDGAITNYVARRKYREEVEALLQLAVGDEMEHGVPLRSGGLSQHAKAQGGRRA